MTAQELYEIVRKEIDVRAFYDPNYRIIQQKIDSNKANFEDTAQLSRLLSQILGEKLASHILELPPNEGRSELCQKLLRDFFNEINHRLAQVQTSQDRKNGVGLGAVKPQFPAERVQNVAGSLNDTTVSDSTIQRRCRNAVSNVANAMHDTFIQVNAKFRNNAGLFVQVSRTGGAECCDWCAQVSGTFWGYNRDLREVFRRHDNCTCTITYTSSKTRSHLVGESDGAGGTTAKWVESRKSWQEKPILPDVRPTRFTPEQAKQFEAKQLRKQGLVRDGNGVKWIGKGKTLDLAPESSTFQEMPISMDELKKVAESAALEVEKSLETQLTNESENVIMNMGRFVEYYGEEHTELLRGYLSSAPELIQKIWNRFAQSLYSIDENYLKTSHYDPVSGGVRLNIEDAAIGDLLLAPYETVFHEYAHQIDYLLNNSSKEKAFSEIYKGGILGKKIEEEVEQALKLLFLLVHISRYLEKNWKDYFVIR